MTYDAPLQRALISVSNKAGIIDFARALSNANIQIISTGGTAKVIADAGIPVTSVDSLTGFPEMLDGRVKTLHPIIHGGLLAVRDNPSHVASMKEFNIKPIDLICIDLYPFEETITKKGIRPEEVIEQIDIGGPAMIRSAAKNYRFVTVVTNPMQYPRVLAELQSNNGSTTLELREDFANDAFIRTADYDTSISQWMTKTSSGMPTRLKSNCTRSQILRYGENPNQSAAVYRDPDHNGPSVVTAEILAGKPLSYNNLMDAAAALDLVQDLNDATGLPSAVIIKHANPCGAAVAATLIDAIDTAWKCDPLAAFGGIVAVSSIVTIDIANTIAQGEKFLEVIVAPTFTADAVETLSSRWKNIRLLAVGNEQRRTSWLQLKSVEGGILLQENAPISADSSNWSHVAGPAPTTSQLSDATIAWITCAHLKSNSISIVDNNALIGGGMGQVDRVSAARLAIGRAGDRLASASSAVAGSDAFFPFPDGPELLINAGIKCIIQPGGSVRDQETIDICEANGVTLLLTGARCFRH